MFAKFAVLFFFTCSPLCAFQQGLLKNSDVQVIMKQILSQHLGEKKMTKKALQNAIKTYVEQFDPDRIYLLQSEINLFLSPTSEELDRFLKDYEQGNYHFFAKLDQTIKNSILRSRAQRQTIEKEFKDNLFKDTSLDRKEFVNYAKNETELKLRLKNNLENYIRTQIRRYGVPTTPQRKNFIIHAYEENLRNLENQYLYQNDAGESLPIAEQENLAALHILKALTSSLDSHTSFYEANEAYDIRLHLQKEFQGIGLSFKEAPEGVIVTNIMEGSSAAKSKLIKAGDILLEINDKPVQDLSFEKIMDLLHDETKEELKLNLKRPAGNGEPQKNYSVTLKRQIIVINNDRVDVSDEKFGNGIIGIIKLHSFYQGADISSEKDVQKAIDDLEKKGNLRGLILDLRDNRGGFLTQAIKVAGLFTTSGVIVISKYADGEERFYRDVDGKVSYEGPLIVLTSKITASAAEIVAQALQDYGVALIVGDEHTYGKGTIQTQTVTDSKSPSYFKVTVGKYYTVSGKTPQKEGILADIVAPSRWGNIEVGEKYANTVEADKIPDSFNDSLNDVKSELKPWYLKYYTPKLQHRTNTWRDLLPTLQKNSQYRIANNKNYQYYIKGAPDMSKDRDEDFDQDINESMVNGGEDDLQLQEAVNIIKDMSLLYSAKSKNEK